MSEQEHTDKVKLYTRDVPLLWLITVPSAALCAINIIFFPQILPGTPLSKLFIGICGINLGIWAIWVLFIYPPYISPLRRLPTPTGGWPLIKYGTASFQRPAGQAFLKFMNTIDHDGLIRMPGFFHSEGLFIAGPDTLAEVLVHKNYDYEKPAELRKFLRYVLGDGLILTEGDEHKFQRKHILPAFSFRHIKELIPIFWSRSAAMREGVLAEVKENAMPDGRAVVELNHWANKVTLDIIGVAGLGRNFNALTNADDPLVKNYEEILEPTKEKLVFFVCHMLFGRRIVGRLPWKLNERLNATTGALRGFCLDLVRAKRGQIKQGEENLDILSLLIKSNCFDDGTIVDQLLTFIAAGHETTSSAFTWATYLLSKNPDIQVRLREEIRSNLPSPNSPFSEGFDLATSLESLPILHGVTQEVLRLYPSVPVTIRITVRDTYIGTQLVPKGTRIMLSPWAINRCPKIWGPLAESFTPSRWVDGDGHLNNTGGALGNNYCNLTFLHGPRSCIGEKFAKSELKALIAVFVGAFEMEMGNLGEVGEPAGVITTKPKNGMRLRLRPLEGW